MTAGTFEFFIIENVIPANTPQKHSMNLQLQSYFFIPREIVLLIKKMKKGIKVQKIFRFIRGRATSGSSMKTGTKDRRQWILDDLNGWTGSSFLYVGRKGTRNKKGGRRERLVSTIFSKGVEKSTSQFKNVP